MDDGEIKVGLADGVPEEDFISLYKEAGWWSPEYDADTSFIEAVVAGSAAFAAAFSADGRMVGMGRAVSDGCSDAYIQDVVVARDFRGKGIGRRIERLLVESLLERGIDWIGLIAEPGSAEFHSKLGFAAMEGHAPMKLDLDAFRRQGGDPL